MKIALDTTVKRPRRMLRYDVFLVTSFLGALLLLAACGSPAATPMPTATARPTPTTTPTPATKLTPTATLTPTAKLTPTSKPLLHYDAPFPMTVDPAKTYTAPLKTAKGQIIIQLNAAKEPNTVNNFVNLARAGFYDNTTFHRVLPNFMAQGGDPTGTGGGGPGYTIPDEFTDLRHEAGVVSMANTGAPNSGSSQFFNTTVATPWLDPLNPDGTPKACGIRGVSCHVVFV